MEDANLAEKRLRRGGKGRAPLDVIERQKMKGESVILRAVRTKETDGPFTTFSEWAEEADEKAYGWL